MQKRKAMQWVKALRSGKYKQGHENLRKVDKQGETHHCCLGVLGEISGCDTADLNENGYLDASLMEECGLKSEEGKAFNEFDEEVGVKIRNGNGLEDYESLADANDCGSSFKRIATWIEKNYKLL